MKEWGALALSVIVSSVLLLQPALVDGHALMTIPPTRNAIGKIAYEKEVSLRSLAWILDCVLVVIVVLVLGVPGRARIALLPHLVRLPSKPRPFFNRRASELVSALSNHFHSHFPF